MRIHSGESQRKLKARGNDGMCESFAWRLNAQFIINQICFQITTAYVVCALPQCSGQTKKNPLKGLYDI